MKIKKQDTTLNVRLNSEVKKAAEEKLALQGKSMAEFIREQIERAAKMKV